MPVAGRARTSALPFALALSIALPALAAQRGVPDATPAGKAVDCVRLLDIRETRVRSDEVIDFVLRDRRVLRNTLPARCPQLGFERSFGYRTSLSQLCSVDIITVLHPGTEGPGASCGLGPFQPVTLAGGAR